jgi:hypothetical protein
MRLLCSFALAAIGCLPFPIENRGSPELPPPRSETPETVLAEEPSPRGARTCSEARAALRRSFERNDDLALARATREEERLCEIVADAAQIETDAAR